MENNNLNTALGKRMTFFQLFSEDGHDIEIPIIQRDYAQGRPNAVIVRNLFLDALLNYLKEGKPERDLDFVYGSISKYGQSLFIPLDGQQRLTTLFLLHWYLAQVDGQQSALRAFLMNGNKSRFRYETRTSSSEFCDGLMNFELTNIPSLSAGGESLSTIIKGCNWYYSSWDYDPTIQSMLTMLDAIHEKFGNSNLLFGRLVNPARPIITFHFLNLQDFELTDDLYIKMNSRGKPLTPFENFKAEFEAHLSKFKFNDAPPYSIDFSGVSKTVTVQKYFAHKIDTDWANLFWAFRKDGKASFDSMIMNFIYATGLNYYAAITLHTKANDNVRALIWGRSNPQLFHQYFKLKCFDEKYTTNLIALLDLLQNGDGKAKCFLSDDFYYNEAKELEKALYNSFGSFAERIQFYAYCQYLSHWGSSEGLSDWMRVIHNLTENTQYNREDEFLRSIKSLRQWMPISNKIMEYLRKKGWEIPGFLGLQVQEEKIKACLIDKGTNWVDAIYQAEHHGYFKGQIAFLLNFSGIEDYYLSHQHCNWTEDEDSMYFEEFKNYKDKAFAVFDSSGLKDFDGFLWERALLSKGDYLIKEGSNYSFLINNDRDISWKRLLRDKNVVPSNDEGLRKSVKDLLDDKCFDDKEIEKSLKQIIEQSHVEDWREYFIALPEMISFLGTKKYIRYKSDDEVYLLKGERMSGYHAEFYSYALFLQGLKGKEFAPFKGTWYYEVKGDDDKPCAIIYGWEYEKKEFQIEISYYDGENGFLIKFLEKSLKLIPEEIKDILAKFEFYEDERAMTSLGATTEQTLDVLGQICNELNSISNV